MSHFAVMVVGKDVEEQLEKYDENLVYDEYDAEVRDYRIDSFKRFCKREKGIEVGDSIDEAYTYYGQEYNGNEWFKKDDGKWYEKTTYNPHSKWDWYVIGGRFSGDFFTHLTEEGKKVISYENYGEPGVFNNDVGVDSIEKKYIDFAKIREEAAENARDYYRYIASLFDDGVIPKIEITFNRLKEMYPNKSIEEIREIYFAQSALKKVEKAKEKGRKGENRLGFFFSLEDYQCTEDEYAESAYKKALVPFALVKDGEWYERGEIGWFGCVSNEMEADKWNDFVNKTIEELDENEILTIVDCHI